MHIKILKNVPYMIDDKLKNCFDEMVVYKDLKKSNFFNALSLPSFMRDWILKKFEDEDGYFDTDQVARFVKTYLPKKEDWNAIKNKVVIDAVSSSRFITQKKSRELAKKLTAEASEFQRKELRRNITATHRVKANNEQIYYTVDTVNEAINKGKKISFKYTEYTPELKKVFRNDGEEYTLSPYALFWNEDYYYVVGWSDKHENVSVFRADRLYKPEILKEKAVKRPDGFSLDAYSKQIFEMYDGDPVEVRLGCRNDLAKYVVDRFGDKLETKPLSSESFEVTVEVALSPTFYGWLFGFAGGIRILGPSEVIAEYNEMLNSALTAQSL